jgi:signal transduction histidine kinase
LALVKLILEAHGTMMKVESEEGGGSVFSFPLLPVHDSE